ncbi:HET-domain-containing protein [Hypoxylon sp. FL0543]|nr:HET-domain-containing protein [Hypoxylon sp. FL0543]
MRLINTQTLELEEYIGDQVPGYAILSHTWGKDEATFQGWQSPSRPYDKAGYRKILDACKQARYDKFEYLWCDTVCIDKSSSAELSEAINSMFSWYNKSRICYAYLADVAWPKRRESSLRNSRWFTRGWTLQELLAPESVVFYDRKWIIIGHKEDLTMILSEITRIPMNMMGPRTMRTASIAQKMSWIATRTTTRIEDMAYCMLGIFDLNMPLLYGEGAKAFIRLQEELIKVSNDLTIFCWAWPEDKRDIPEDWASMLAPSPKGFLDSGDFSPRRIEESALSITYSMTNAGLSIRLPTFQALSYCFVLLEVRLELLGYGDDAGFLHRQSHVPSVRARMKLIFMWQRDFPINQLSHMRTLPESAAFCSLSMTDASSTR